jgi:hypothetical protein
MRATIPIVEQIEVAVSRVERAEIESLAKKRAVEEPDLSSIAHFGPGVQSGLESGPALLIEDRSEIALSKEPEESLFGYRLALLADSNDLLVLSGSRCAAFETYLADLLGIGTFEVLIAKNPNLGRKYPLPRRCIEQAEILRHIAEVARTAGPLSIVPYSATGHVWALAKSIAEASDARVFIAAPPPRLCRRVNDKLWFAKCVKELFGQEAHSPFRSAFGPAALAARVRDLARNRQRVVIKVPDSSGSAGNLLLASEDLRDAHLPDLRSRLIRLLKSFGPDWHFPLEVEVWERPVVSSPSVQVWIPHREEGAPILEGIFEQIIEGDQGEFVGATRVHLPSEWGKRLAHQATCLAILFQELGYFGRCSFDCVIAGNSYDSAKLHWIECNGRWGGVSIPMTFSNRLGAAVSKSEIAIVQRGRFEVPPRPFRDVLLLFADMLFTPGKSTEGIIPLTPAGFERGTGVHFMTIAGSLERTKDIAKKALDRITER